MYRTEAITFGPGYHRMYGETTNLRQLSRARDNWRYSAFWIMPSAYDCMPLRGLLP
jgi:hypothetical protein